MGPYIVTFGYLEFQQLKSVPFVLMAGPSGRESHWSYLDRFEQDICHGLASNSRNSSQKPTTRTSSDNSGTLEDLGFHHWINWYIDILRHFFAQVADEDLNMDSLPLASLFPILQASFLRARIWSRSIRSVIERSHGGPDIGPRVMKDLYSERQDLRRWLEDTEDDVEHIKRYLRVHQKSALIEHPVFQVLEAESVQLVAQSRRLEGEVRDFLQIQSGISVLEETKKSIELSNRQIQESKRVKVFTVLAFIYVPLNLATSIFGMNLQQLNASGQPLRVFFITAILALFVTGASWFGIDQFNDYTAWRHIKEVKKSISDPPTDFSIAVRIAMIWWLVYRGHFSWMRETGAWHLIMKNIHRGHQLHSKAFISTRFVMDAGFDTDNKTLTAGEYVSKFSRGGPRKYGVDPFRVDPVLLYW
ncbi:MAG: hypothetical protein Q9182_002381 [Xanthomendoza sp. 2 TL-2023]